MIYHLYLECLTTKVTCISLEIRSVITVWHHIHYNWHAIWGNVMHDHRPFSHVASHPTPCIFIGYSPDHKGYWCLNLTTNYLLISRHVEFDETCFLCLPLYRMSLFFYLIWIWCFHHRNTG